MKKIVLVFSLMLISSLSYSQQSLRIGQTIVKDTLEGNLVFRNSIEKCNIFLSGITGGDQLNIMSNRTALQSALYPTQSVIIEGDKNNYYGVDEGGEHIFTIFTDPYLTISMNGIRVKGGIAREPIQLVDLGGKSFEIDGNYGDMWYFDEGLTDDTHITIINVSEGQEIKLFVKGGYNGVFSPSQISWTIHSSAGIEKWVNGSLPSQSLNTDEYHFTRLNGLLYCKKVAEDYQ